MTAPAEHMLAILEAEREIYRTFVHFFHLVDTRQYERVAEECFTPHAEIEYHVPNLHRFSGRDAFTGYLLAHVESRSQMVAHVIGQRVIHWNNGQPHLEAYATVWHWHTAHAMKGVLRPADWTTIGHVADDFERVNGQWLIARRIVTPVGGLVAAGRTPAPGTSA
ncbi:nuclear transport factor 2 family protein [Dactylosporangium sp. NPDC051485]|uniref:nuclear transport factor 2 family protein n=1 Tax=Dactylosporangium sp. NPDC051485 TaxID=3154846 RepID=UPI00342F130E